MGAVMGSLKMWAMQAMGDAPSSSCIGDEDEHSKKNSFSRPEPPSSRTKHRNPMGSDLVVASDDKTETVSRPDVKTATVSRPKPGATAAAKKKAKAAAPKDKKMFNPMFDSGSDSSEDSGSDDDGQDAALPPTKMGTKMSYEREFDDNDDDRWMAVAEEEPWVVDLVAQQPLADDRDHGVDECDKAASSKAHADDEMALAFERYDSDHSGTMSLHELTQMLKSFGCSREEIPDIIDRFDQDHDGFITLKEYERAVLEIKQEDHKWAKKLVNYKQVEKKSRQWLKKQVNATLKMAPMNQKKPTLFIPYGPPGSGKTTGINLLLEARGIKYEHCVDMNIDDLTRSYMREVLHNEDMFKDQGIYFEVRKGWPSTCKAQCLRKAMATRRHIMKECTGRQTSSAVKVIKPAYEQQGYHTCIAYTLVPFPMLLGRLKARYETTGQGYPEVKKLAQLCRVSARNLKHFEAAGGDRCQVVFCDNTGAENRLVKSRKHLYAVTEEHQWQREMRALLVRQADQIEVWEEANEAGAASPEPAPT